MGSPLAPTIRMSYAAAACALTALCAGATANPVSVIKKEKAKTSRPALYMVGYSHLDTQWCWSYPQVIREFIPNTLHQNFDLFKQYPDYVFNWTGSNRYRFMQEYYPADFAQLKKYVAQGRWFPAGSSVEEGDVNSPSEESLIRQVLYGNEYFHQQFGTQSTEYMLPDCFGFPASLPSILAHCGLKGFSTQKLTWGSSAKTDPRYSPGSGIPFNVGRWIGPDGHEMVCALNPGAYDSDVRTDLATDPHTVDRLKKDETRDGVAVDYRYYGVGDRGGAPDPESVKFVQQSVKTPGPVHIYAGKSDQMFNDLSPEDVAKLPTYKGDLELTQHSAGSLTSETAQKRWNRKNELLANATETASVAANWLGTLKYEKAKITDAWLRFLPGQFHDLMAGTALPIAYNYTWNDEIIAMNEFADVLQSSVGGVSRALDTQVKGIPLTVYNPLSIARDDVVEATIDFPGSVPVNVEVFDANGQALPTQIVSRSERTAKILFKGTVPSLGFSVFDVRASNDSVGPAGPLKVSRSGLENSRYAVKIDENGNVSSVYDKLNSKELLTDPIHLVYIHENPHDFPAWNMDWNDQRQKPTGYVSGPAQVQIVENGPVRVGLRITRRHDGSKFIQTLKLGTGQSADRLDFVTQIDWQGKESALKAVFPLAVSNPQATYNWGLGTIKRGNNDPRKYEVASHGWIDLTNVDNSYGASILDDCKYGSDKPDDKTLRLTLIYTPGVRGGYQHQATQDWGRNHMTYSLMGHNGSWEGSGTQWASAELNQPLIAFQTTPHPGVLGTRFSLAQSSDPAVSLEAVKQAETDGEVVLRLNELAGQAHKGVQIKFASPILSAREIDGQERTIGRASLQGGALDVDVNPYEPRAFAVKLGKPSKSESAPTGVPLELPYNLVGISKGFGEHDGDFDGVGNSIPGDLVPEKINDEGLPFKFGPKGAKNVLVPDGQTIKLPSGTGRKLYLVGASVGDDSAVELNFGSKTQTSKLQKWDGYVGQWDSREWGGQVPELTYDWQNPLVGLVPGYIKRQPVAWYADHKRTKDGGNDIYAFCYLFKAMVDVPDGATSVTLEKNSAGRIAAITVATNPNDAVRPAQPLYDVLEHNDVDGPSISIANPVPNAEKIVTLQHPMYWSPEAKLRYTLDGTVPNSLSKVYTRPFAVGKSATLTVATVDASGKVLNQSKRAVTVDDAVPASVTSAVQSPADPHSEVITAKVVFSEEVDRASAEDPKNYWPFTGETFLPVKSATLAEDGKTVALVYAKTPKPLTSLKVKGVEDLGGLLCDLKVPLAQLSPAFTADSVMSFDAKGAGTIKAGVAKLPVLGTSPWTINFFVKMDRQPETLTVLAGFGDGEDSNGAERFLIAREGRIYFWASNVDIDSGVAFDLNRWQMISATYDGKTVHLFKDGKEIKSEATPLSDARPDVRIAPPPPWDYGHRFQGQIAGFTIWDDALLPGYLEQLAAGGPK
jgi:alpha-mannosidase